MWEQDQTAAQTGGKWNFWWQWQLQIMCTKWNCRYLRDLTVPIVFKYCKYLVHRTSQQYSKYVGTFCITWSNTWQNTMCSVCILCISLVKIHQPPCRCLTLTAALQCTQHTVCRTGAVLCHAASISHDLTGIYKILFAIITFSWHLLHTPHYPVTHHQKVEPYEQAQNSSYVSNQWCKTICLFLFQNLYCICCKTRQYNHASVDFPREILIWRNLLKIPKKLWF